ncbi:hypothetical protein OF83DRAFT_117700 [Amylostereum chailletii]|nr:hypothetical protein OF83DRAFT_117700 [Amylostereum chailletii]
MTPPSRPDSPLPDSPPPNPPADLPRPHLIALVTSHVPRSSRPAIPPQGHPSRSSHLLIPRRPLGIPRGVPSRTSGSFHLLPPSRPDDPLKCERPSGFVPSPHQHHPPLTAPSSDPILLPRGKAFSFAIHNPIVILSNRPTSKQSCPPTASHKHTYAHAVFTACARPSYRGLVSDRTAAIMCCRRSPPRFNIHSSTSFWKSRPS